MTTMQTGLVSGYSTQAKISLEIAARINKSRINLWFASEFNPINNQDSSNPLLIFRELDWTGKTGEHNEKSRELEGNLQAWVQEAARLGHIDRDVDAAATLAIASALAAGDFSPVVLRLRNMEKAEAKAEPDEYHVKNVPLESDNLLQIIPDPNGAAIPQRSSIRSLSRTVR